MEIRIYFECLEQASHFILPIVQEAVNDLGRNIDIRLVKLAKDYSCYSKKIAPFVFWKEPDILISVVDEKKEYPLLVIEFSSAVFTEDHELQRFDGMVAAAKSNSIYAKISPTSKRSASAHGGNIEFDYARPFSLIYNRFKKLFFHFEWACDSKGVVKVNSNYVSCPHRIREFELLIGASLSEVITHGYTADWIDKTVKVLCDDPYFADWLGRLKATPDIDLTRLNTTRTRWIRNNNLINSGALELKLNRFGHAMDPERGMLSYYGAMGQKIISKMLFDIRNDAWYKATPKEAEIKDYLKQNGLDTPYDFLYCFALGSGLHENKQFMQIVKTHETTSSERVIIDLTNFIKNHFFELSKPLRTIFAFSVLFTIENTDGERKVIFKWQHYDEPEFFENYVDIAPIKERITFEEDDVTYIAIHNILRPNGYRVIAASYPGAQADRVILVEPGTGRRQKRKYIDIICYLPNKTTNLQENKGKYEASGAQQDIVELSKYKKEKTYQQGLKNFQAKFASESLNGAVRIGIGFWANTSFTVSDVKNLDLQELDYFIYISNDRKRWNIWRTGEDDMFSIAQGKVSIPKTHEVMAQESSRNTSLRPFLKPPESGAS